MQPTAESRVSTVVDVDLGNRSYLIYIGAGLQDEPDLLQDVCAAWFFFQSAGRQHDNSSSSAFISQHFRLQQQQLE